MSDIISYLTKIRFGAGAIGDIAEELALLGIRAPLVVTDAGLLAAGLVSDVIERAGLRQNTAVFSGTPENPTEAAVRAALAAYRAAGADGLIAIGGGSSIDLAKGVALMATHDGPLENFAAIHGGITRIGPDTLPLIAVPTTAGTGSEVGRATLLTLANGRKLGFISPHIIPNVAICDPALTLSLPPALTAATGMDALSHCIETYLSPRQNPVADAIALDGLARGWAWLPRAFTGGTHLEARHEMMMCALQGALAFQKGLGAVHSMSHALGGMAGYRLHHGTLNAVLLPVVLRFNAPGNEAKYARMRAAIGVSEAADLAQVVELLNRDLGLPAGLGQMGVGPEALPLAAAWSLEDHSTATNGRPATQADFAAMLAEAL